MLLSKGGGLKPGGQSVCLHAGGDAHRAEHISPNALCSASWLSSWQNDRGKSRNSLWEEWKCSKARMSWVEVGVLGEDDRQSKSHRIMKLRLRTLRSVLGYFLQGA